MALLLILVSCFAAAALAKRIAHNHVQLQSQDVANSPGLVPDLVQSFSAAHLAVMVGARVQVGMAPQLYSHRRVGHLQSHRGPLMSLEDGGRHVANLPTDWRAHGGNVSAPLAYAENDYESPVQLLREDSLEGEDASKNTNTLQMDGVSARVSATSNPVPTATKRFGKESNWGDPSPAEEDKKQKTADEITLNMSKALDILRLDIPQMWRQPHLWDWGIYTDDLETDFTNIANPMALRLLGAVAPALSPTVKGLKLNKQALQELRVFCARFVKKDVVMKETGIGPDPVTGEQVITSRWKTELRMKPLKVPFRLQQFAGVDWTPESIVTVDAVSRFHFNDEGKIYRHSVDQFGFLLDKKSVSSRQADLLHQSTDLFQDFSRDPWVYAWFLVHGDPQGFFDF